MGVGVLVEEGAGDACSADDCGDGDGGLLSLQGHDGVADLVDFGLSALAAGFERGGRPGGGTGSLRPGSPRPRPRVLSAAKGLPVVGKYLLQKNVIKIGIPVVGVPLAVALNRYSTLLAGRHAQAVFRNEARVIELAEGLSKRSQHPQLMLWVAWLVIMADHKIVDDEALLMRHLVRLVRDQHQVVDEQLAHLIDVDPAEVWQRLGAESGDLSDLLDVANRVATVDGAVNALERAVISELRDRYRRV
ncbi:MAG: hypothetical protein QOF44_3994, partial [Streptomyces sp.]|nr:hypothetical protein [Streptomyces sp.]